MRLHGLHKSVHCVTSLVVMMLCAAIGVKPAHATCGDYLHQQMSPVTTVEHVLESGPVEGRPSRLPQSPGCRDGSCRSNHSLPLPEPTRVARGTDQWGCAASPELAQPESREWHAPGDIRAATACPPVEFFRPPRIAG